MTRNRRGGGDVLDRELRNTGIVDFALLSASRATDNLDHEWYGNDEERRQTENTTEVWRQASDLDVITAAARRNPHLNRGVPEDITDLRSAAPRDFVT